jgi:hypothetical protein
MPYKYKKRLVLQAMTNSMYKPIPKNAEAHQSFCNGCHPPLAQSHLGTREGNSNGEKTRSLKLVLSTEPNNKDGKTLTKSFEIFRSGSPEEWILWRTDLDEVCGGMSITTGPARNRMIQQF